MSARYSDNHRAAFSQLAAKFCTQPGRSASDQRSDFVFSHGKAPVFYLIAG
jgi:hypothetical protein